jgi:hypothetical protein
MGFIDEVMLTQGNDFGNRRVVAACRHLTKVRDFNDGIGRSEQLDRSGRAG